jgi:chloramphenicol 3-O phosphotransferase
MNEGPRIIVLNGVGSVGKSSIARALQAMTLEPFLHVQLDTFIAMLPSAYQEQHPDGFVFETVHQDGKPLVVIRSGGVARRALQGMRHAIIAMARQGNNMIVDDVALGSVRAHYGDLAAEHHVSFVGVFAPLDVLEARERQRGDRRIGLARWQYERVHKDTIYDLEIDASRATPLQCATVIKETFQL